MSVLVNIHSKFIVIQKITFPAPLSSVDSPPHSRTLLISCYVTQYLISSGSFQVLQRSEFFSASLLQDFQVYEASEVSLSSSRFILQGWLQLVVGSTL